MPAAPRPFVTRFAAALAVLAVAGPAPAADLPVRITSARVGFPSVGRDGLLDPADSVCKFGAWAPVYVEFEVVGDVPDGMELVVETPDADGVMTRLAVPVDPHNGLRRRISPPGPDGKYRVHRQGYTPYVRPAGGAAETTLFVRGPDGGPLSDPYRLRNLRTREAAAYVVLGLGSTFPGFDLPKPGGGAPDPNAPPGPLRNGRVELTAVTDYYELPQDAVGYEGADLVVLSTAGNDLAGQLCSAGFDGPRSKDAMARENALWDWVWRGGRLVVSTGAEPGLAYGFTYSRGFEGRLDARPRTVDQLPVYWAARETSQTSTLGGVLRRPGGFSVADLALQPGRPGRLVSPPPARQGDKFDPIAVQVPYGLGKVTVIGFDLDRPPFAPDPARPGDKGFSARADFWDWVLREGGANRASVGNEAKPFAASASGPTGEEDEIAAAVRTHLDTFAGVPVISFGGVAALIVLYGLLVAPVEYLVLRRVLRNPGLTWLTLPLIVLTVAVLAYVSAARAKGTDLRVNKIDVIDVFPDDPGHPKLARDLRRMHGTTWFAAFAPRSEAFAVAVAPADGWGLPVRGRVGWNGGPRGGRAGLLRRSYEYAPAPGEQPDPSGAQAGVPVATWATKGFVGSWEAWTPVRETAPLAESRLEHPPGDPTKAVGTFVNRLPVPELTDCVAFYAGQVYPLGTILHGQEVRLVLDRGTPAAQWLQENGRLPDLLAGATGRTAGAARGLPLWGLLFHEAALRNDEGVIPRNASVRRLDQSWRLTPDNRSEVIVMGRAGPVAGDPVARAVPLPTRLTLTRPDGSAPPYVGRQETYVRLYLPVK